MQKFFFFLLGFSSLMAFIFIQNTQKNSFSFSVFNNQKTNRDFFHYKHWNLRFNWKLLILPDFFFISSFNFWILSQKVFQYFFPFLNFIVTLNYFEPSDYFFVLYTFTINMYEYTFFFALYNLNIIIEGKIIWCGLWNFK